MPFIPRDKSKVIWEYEPFGESIEVDSKIEMIHLAASLVTLGYDVRMRTNELQNKFIVDVSVD